MNKSVEIEILRNAIALLGKDSYCGPWLTEVVASVESQIRSDYFPTATLESSIRACEYVKLGAEQQAKFIIEAAQVKAAAISRKCEAELDTCASTLRNSLRNLQG